MNVMFTSTQDVFKAERLLKNNGVPCEVIPNHIHDKAYCGFCVRIPDEVYEEADRLLNDIPRRNQNEWTV